MSLTTPTSVRKLQRALYAKAKANPTYRFYALYDKICRKDVLLWAWSCCRANGGSSGVDGVLGWVKGIARDTRTPFETQWAHVFTVRDRKVVRWHGFANTAARYGH